MTTRNPQMRVVVDPEDMDKMIAELTEVAARLSFLSEAARVLSSSIDVKVTFDHLVHLVVPEMADWCSISVLMPNGKIARLATEHINPIKAKKLHLLEEAFPISIDADTGPGFSIRTGNSELVREDSPHQYLKRVNPNTPRVIAELGLYSYMTVPMILENKRIIGAVFFARSEDPSLRYDDQDLKFANELTKLATNAVHNSMLHEQAVGEFEKLKVRTKIREDYVLSQIHDVKTPLTALSLAIQLLAQRTSGDTDSLVKTATKNLERAVQMINNLRPTSFEEGV